MFKVVATQCSESGNVKVLWTNPGGTRRIVCCVFGRLYVETREPSHGGFEWAQESLSPRALTALMHDLVKTEKLKLDDCEWSKKS